MSESNTPDWVSLLQNETRRRWIDESLTRIRQCIICGLGGETDDRQRDQEFAASRSEGKAELFKRLEEIVHQSEKIVSSLSAADLVRPRVIQGMDETGISAIVHVTEHLSYHTGEMTYITKLLKNVDTKYYDSTKLRARNQSAR